MITSVNASLPTYAGGMKTVAAGGTAEGNKAALQAALNTGKCVHIPYGSYYLKGPVNMITNGQVIFGQGIFQTILVCSGTDTIIYTNGKHSCGIRDLHFKGLNNVGPTNGFAFCCDGVPTFGASPNQILGGFVEKCHFESMWDGVGVFDTNCISITDVNMQNMHGNWGVNATAPDANQRIDNVKITRFVYSPSQGARDNNRGTGLIVNGFVHSVQLYNFQAVAPYIGIDVRNDFGLPLGNSPAFILGHDVEIDFPLAECLRVSQCDRVRMVNSYFHGSQREANIVIGQGRDATFVACNISGAWKTAIYVECVGFHIAACTFDWNGQETPGIHHNILAGNNAQYGTVTGGHGDNSRVAYGICRINPGTWIQVAAADAIGPRNF